MPDAISTKIPIEIRQGIIQWLVLDKAFISLMGVDIDEVVYAVGGLQLHKPTNWIPGIGGWTSKRGVVLFTKDKVLFARRGFVQRSKLLSLHEYPVGGLKSASYKQRMVGETLYLTFEDGRKVELEVDSKGFSAPVKRIAEEGIHALI